MHGGRPASSWGSVWQTPILTNLSWTSDGSRLGMVVASDLPAKTNRPPSVVGLDVESGNAVTLHEFEACGSCRHRPLRVRLVTRRPEDETGWVVGGCRRAMSGYVLH